MAGIAVPVRLKNVRGVKRYHGVSREGVSEKAIRLRTQHITREAEHYLLGHCGEAAAEETNLKHLTVSGKKMKHVCAACAAGKSKKIKNE